jgi:hypothetical protein
MTFKLPDYAIEAAAGAGDITVAAARRSLCAFLNAMLEKGDAKRAEEMPGVPSTIIIREDIP